VIESRGPDQPPVLGADAIDERIALDHARKE